MFEAEKMAAKAGIFHKRCFTCDTCARLENLIFQIKIFKGSIDDILSEPLLTEIKIRIMSFKFLSEPKRRRYLRVFCKCKSDLCIYAAEKRKEINRI